MSLKEILTNALTWLIGAVLVPAVPLMISKTRNWLLGPHKLATAALAAIAGASMAMLTVSIFWSFAPIGVTQQRFGANGAASPNKPNDPYFTAADSPREIARKVDYPYCALTSMIMKTGTGSCEIIESADGRWEAIVTGGAQCKATCFKAKLFDDSK